MGNLAIIPARGGSKRIPRKNIKDFLGKPIIAYSIEKALESGLFEEVMVSTDDEEIATIARSFGAKVPFLRSETKSNDHATTMDVIHEVISKYTEQGKSFDHICCIYPTAPLTTVQNLKDGFDLLQTEQHETVFPMVAFSYPIWRGIKRNKAGESELISKEFSDARSQDIETIYHDAGQWYWINKKNLVLSILDSKMGNIILSEMDVQDIDHESDWQLAELKYKLRNLREK